MDLPLDAPMQDGPVIPDDGSDYDPSTEDAKSASKRPKVDLNQTRLIQSVACKKPWVLRSVIKGVQRSAVGSAFVVSTEARQIITNAHVVSGQNTIHVRRPGDPKKWKASLLCEGKACDLALLTVVEDGFWTGIQAVHWQDVPELQKSITVVGYPVGGESLSITQGIVSRVTMSPYASGAPSLINIQIDAAINSGNSGGPAFSSLEDGTVAGVAYSRHKSAEGTGYIIPYCVVRHFLEEYQQHGVFRGICCLGVRWQKLENPSLRAYHEMKDDHSGLLVFQVNKLSPAAAAVDVGDVIMAVNNTRVADDGTVEFRNDERIDAAHVVTGLHIGEEVELTLLRRGRVEIVRYMLQASTGGLMPGLHGVDCWPSYLMFGGLVFVTLYLDHLFGARNWRAAAPADLLSQAGRFCEFEGQKIVVLSQILAADINFGYTGGFGCVRCLKMNGVDINNLRHLAELLVSETSKFVKFELHGGPIVVLERSEAIASGPLILKQNAIAADRSADLLPGAPSPLLQVSTGKGLPSAQLNGARDNDSLMQADG